MNDTEKDIDYQNKPRHNGKVLVGMVLLAVGGILLLEQFTFLDIPGWIWSWPTWIIIWGLYSGARHNYRNSTWAILLFIGFAGVLNEAIPGLHLGNLIWPAAIILIGVWIILRRNHTWEKGKWDRKWDKGKWEAEWKQKWDARYHTSAQPQEGQPAEAGDTDTPPPPPPNIGADDFLDATSIFGGAKKTVLSKNFRGGDITNIFGGAEIDLTMADIDGRVVLDITQVFGGTKIIVPSHWQVVSNLSAVFAGVDDKRLRKTGSGDNNKILVLEGVSIFAGVDIRSF
ncbi:MAG: LiaF transmembrane domain-containing protein [Mucilaginibacter sp.]